MLGLKITRIMRTLLPVELFDQQWDTLSRSWCTKSRESTPTNHRQVNCDLKIQTPLQLTNSPYLFFQLCSAFIFHFSSSRLQVAEFSICVHMKRYMESPGISKWCRKLFEGDSKLWNYVFRANVLTNRATVM